MTTKKPVQSTENNKKNQTQVEQTNTNINLDTSTEPNPTHQVQEQFCSCCKPGEWVDFFNKKKSADMFCSEVFVPDSNFSNTSTKFKSHKIFVKKNDI